VRADGSRKKKLRVAFHFQFSNPAAWKCDECRRNRLERARRCGWLRQGEETEPKLVWARHKVSTMECPRSYITANSVEWLERFVVRKRLGRPEIWELGAREAEAMLLLEQELAEEVSRGHDQ
jgi:hypothetical protein